MSTVRKKNSAVSKAGGGNIIIMDEEIEKLNPSENLDEDPDPQSKQDECSSHNYINTADNGNGDDKKRKLEELMGTIEMLRNAYKDQRQQLNHSEEELSSLLRQTSSLQVEKEEGIHNIDDTESFREIEQDFLPTNLQSDNAENPSDIETEQPTSSSNDDTMYGNKEKTAAADIHMIAVQMLVTTRSRNKGDTCFLTLGQLFSVLSAVLVLFSQVVLSSFLLEKVLLPSCSSSDDCPKQSFCFFDYSNAFRVHDFGSCEGECHLLIEDHKYQDLAECGKFADKSFEKDWCLSYFHCYDPYYSWEDRCSSNDECQQGLYCEFKYNGFNGIREDEIGWCHECQYFTDSFEDPRDDDDITTKEWCGKFAGKFADKSYEKDLCLTYDHCFETNEVYKTNEVCDHVIKNREILDSMGIILLVIVGLLLAMSIYEDITSGRKQLYYLQQGAPRGFFKQVCASVIIARCIFLPIYIVQVAVALMIGGKDGSLQPTNIVLSALSITFVLQIDDVVGKFVLQILNLQEDLVKKYKCDRISSFQKGFGVVVNVVVTITCFVLFLYQIITVNDFGSFSFSKSVNPHHTRIDDESCSATVWALIFNGILVTVSLLVLEVLGAVIELSQEFLSRKEFKFKRFCWKFFTLLSAGLLYYSFGTFPFGIQVLKFKDLPADQYVPWKAYLYEELLIASMALLLSFIAVASMSWLCDDFFVDEQDIQKETGEEDNTSSEETEENRERCPPSFFTNKHQRDRSRVCMLSAVGLMSALSIFFVYRMSFIGTPGFN